MKSRTIGGAFAALLAIQPLAQAQAVTFADLAGQTVTAKFAYAQNVQLLDQGRTINNESRTTMTLAIGPGNRIAQDFKIQIIAPSGREVGGFTGQTINAELNKPTKWQHGEMVFVFENESLIRLQTFDKGGRKITIAFKRSPSGLTCSVEAPFSKEEGSARGIDTTSQTNRQRIEILSAKTIASSCRVAKTGA